MPERKMPEKRMPESRMPEYSWDPVDELRSIQHRLSRIMGEVNTPVMGERNTQVPEVDIREHGNSVIITADLPGLTKSDIHVDVREDNMLEISAERKAEKEREEKGFIRHERAYTRFYRAVQLPVKVDKTKAKASYTNGVLEITLPVAERPKTRGIPIS